MKPEQDRLEYLNTELGTNYETFELGIYICVTKLV